MTGNQRIRVGIVGAGYVSTYHIRAVQSTGHATVVGIADANRSRAQEMAGRFGIPNFYGSLSEMAAAAPEVIHVLTPPAFHCELTLQALEMGCHVMVEKPMAENAADCDRMIAKAQEKDRLLTVNHSARMDPIVLRGLELIQQGVIGDVLGLDFFRSSDYPAWGEGPVPPPFRNGSYPFQDLGVHALYLVEAFLGELRNVEVTYRSSGRDANLYLDEWRAATTTSRGTGNIYLSWNVRPMQNELFVHGTRGVMHVDCFLQTCTVRRTYPLPKAVQRMLAAALNSVSMLVQVGTNGFRFIAGKLRPSPGIHESVVRFYRALHEGTPLPVPAAEGRRIVAWMESVSREADECKRQAFTEVPPVIQPRVLVTGSSGFLGSALLRRLRAQGESVRVLRRRPASAADNPRLHFVYGDLGDSDAVDRAVKGVDVVYHVGATMKGWPEDFHRGTVLGTGHIVEACLRHGVKRLVFVSSLSVLDHVGHRRSEPVNESAGLEPYPERRGAYTQTKLAAENLVLQAVRERGLPAVILRPGQIFGQGAETVSPSGAFGLAGRWIVSGSGRHLLPLVYCEDVVDALLLAEKYDRENGAIFHIVDPKPIDQREYLERQQAWARTALGRQTGVVYCPQGLLLLLASGVEIAGALLKRNMPLTRYRIRSLMPLSPVDLSAAEKRLGWHPSVGIREGLKRTFGTGDKA